LGCNCEAAANLKGLGSPFRFLELRGAPAVSAPSQPDPPQEMMTGFVTPAQVPYAEHIQEVPMVPLNINRHHAHCS